MDIPEENITDPPNVWVIRGIHAHSWTEVDEKKQDGFGLMLLLLRKKRYGFIRIVFGETAVRWYDTIELRWFEYIVSYTGERQKLSSEI